MSQKGAMRIMDNSGMSRQARRMDKVPNTSVSQENPFSLLNSSPTVDQDYAQNQQRYKFMIDGMKSKDEGYELNKHGQLSKIANKSTMSKSRDIKVVDFQSNYLRMTKFDR